MIQNVIFGILFLKILFRAYNFYIFAQMFQQTSSEFLYHFRFSGRKPQIHQKLRKRSLIVQHSFARKTSLILRTSTHLTLKIICSRNAAKNLSDFKKFPADMFLLGVRENICTEPFLDAEELHFWNTSKANICIFLYISLRKFFPQRRSNNLSDGVGWEKAE